MAVFIKALNCTGCPVSPCCDIDEFETDNGSDGPETYTFNYDVSAFTGSSISIYFEFLVIFPDGYASLELEADGVQIYGTGCVNPGDDSIVVVPAGTNTLSAIVTQECSGEWIENAWELSITCA